MNATFILILWWNFLLNCFASEKCLEILQYCNKFLRCSLSDDSDDAYIFNSTKSLVINFIIDVNIQHDPIRTERWGTIELQTPKHVVDSITKATLCPGQVFKSSGNLKKYQFQVAINFFANLFRDFTTRVRTRLGMTKRTIDHPNPKWNNCKWLEIRQAEYKSEWLF